MKKKSPNKIKHNKYINPKTNESQKETQQNKETQNSGPHFGLKTTEFGP